MEKANEEKQQQSTPTGLPQEPRLDPWLVFFHGKHRLKHTFYNIAKGYIHAEKGIPCLRGKEICTSSHGWMVLIGLSSFDCFLLNPTTMEKIQLPPLEPSFKYRSCVLSSSPIDPTCIVLFISGGQGGRRVSFRFCSPNKLAASADSSDWTILEGQCVNDATACDGKIYAITKQSNEILIFEVVDTTTGSTLRVRKMEGIGPVPMITTEHYPTSLYALVESCGELYVVRHIYFDIMPHEIIDFEVFKLDFSRKVWERVKSLGDRAFFLGPDSCTSCYASSSKDKGDDLSDSGGLVGNTIYFTLREDRSLYAFDFEDKSTTVSLPCSNVQHHWSQPIFVLLPPSSCFEEYIN